MTNTIEKSEVKRILEMQKRGFRAKLDFAIKHYESMRNDPWVLPQGEKASSGFSLNNTCNIVAALADIEKIKFAIEVLEETESLVDIDPCKGD